MSRVGRAFVAATLLFGTAVLASAVDLAAELAKCAALTDGLVRLACYDALAKRDNAGAAASAPPAPAPAKALAGEAPPASQSSAQCQATTKKGSRCSRRAKDGTRYCWQHGG